MYAAAGGASLASRRAGNRQRQNKKNQKTEQLKAPPPKAVPVAAVPKPPQSKQFHNLPANYIQSNQTTQSSVVKLSRVERNALRPPAAERRHSTANHLKEHTRAKIRESPSIMLPVSQNHLAQPLTPTTLVQNHVQLSPSICHLPQILVPPDLDSAQAHDPERRCSLVRQYEEAEKAENNPVTTPGCDHSTHMCFEIKKKGSDGNPFMYTELDRAMFGSMEYPFSEVFTQPYNQEDKSKFPLFEHIV